MAIISEPHDAPGAIEIELTRDEVQRLLLGVHITVRPEQASASVPTSVTLRIEQ